MKSGIHKEFYILTITICVMIFFSGCKKTESKLNVSIMQTRIQLEVPRFYKKGDVVPEKLRLIYTIKIIKRRDNEDIDYTHLVYEKKDDKYEPLKLVYPINSVEFNKFLYRNIIFVDYYSNETLNVTFDSYDISKYRNKGIELASTKEVFYKENKKYRKLFNDSNQEYYIVTIDDRYNREVEPIQYWCGKIWK